MSTTSIDTISTTVRYDFGRSSKGLLRSCSEWEGNQGFLSLEW